MRISDWSSDVCSSDLGAEDEDRRLGEAIAAAHPVFLPLFSNSPGLSGAPVELIEPIMPVRRAAAEIGHVNLNVDPDGVVRSVTLRIDGGGQSIRHLMELVSQAIEPGDINGSARPEERRVGKEGVSTCSARR